MFRLSSAIVFLSVTSSSALRDSSGTELSDTDEFSTGQNTTTRVNWTSLSNTWLSQAPHTLNKKYTFTCYKAQRQAGGIPNDFKEVIVSANGNSVSMGDGMEREDMMFPFVPGTLIWMEQYKDTGDGKTLYQAVGKPSKNNEYQYASEITVNVKKDSKGMTWDKEVVIQMKSMDHSSGMTKGQQIVCGDEM
mmetsp:Transcript_50075/g.112512  ORF Transcript_50075/g.112512 Transcript_50075/m.112512 type:complete len:191 (-) Transcript_50075:107-679(-)|eukprot:CAMPEP_0197885022 /NCGR_PEP_ID=MMETSP1439-20131203/11268_1 /TAXON_ID=66791 /ORGANISM="Gonyaulax spinifera, Strain CCMP409" /LENGTH=190 /DNA_ID=CAMNT_0043504775 /DNA_START=96 /DNA_END=668 /DNA_ORIENTATION=+